MSGSSCATTGSPIVSSGPTTTSLSTVATPGTNSSISLGPSCRSACATGPTGSDQRDSVLYQDSLIRTHGAHSLTPRRFRRPENQGAGNFYIAPRLEQGTSVKSVCYNLARYLLTF